MNAIPPHDDHILRIACAEFAQRHTVMLCLMALKHSTDGEMMRLIAAMQHRREAIDAIQRLPATTIEGHRAKMRVAIDVMGPAADDDTDEQFVRAVMLDFLCGEPQS